MLIQFCLDKNFKNLSEEEQKEMLGKIFSKMDLDGNENIIQGEASFQKRSFQKRFKRKWLSGHGKLKENTWLLK